MEIESIMQLVTVFVTLIMGLISKKSKYISSNLIPIQNLAIGIIMTIITFLITKDFSIATTFSGLFAGGAYDLVHNLKKITKKGDE